MPGEISPCLSSASIMATPMRSLTLPIGLKNSSLRRMSAFTRVFGQPVETHQRRIADGFRDVVIDVPASGLAFALASFPSVSGRAETARGALGDRKVAHLDKLGLLMTGDHHLRDLHTTRNPKWRLAEIDHNDLDLAPVVAVDRARGVEQSDAVSEREARARPNLRFIPVW